MMKVSRQKPIILIILAVLFSGFAAYSVALRFTRFFLISRSDKVTLLGLLWLLFFVFNHLLVMPAIKRWFDTCSKSKLVRLLVLAALLAGTIMAAFYQFPIFPKQMSIEVKPAQPAQQPAAEYEIAITRMTRSDAPGNEVIPIDLINLAYDGGWQVENEYLLFSAATGKGGSVRYTSYVMGAITIAFLTGADQGSVEVLVNGDSLILDLAAPISGELERTFRIPNTWQNADGSRRQMLVIGIVSDLASLFLVALLFLVLIDQLIFEKRLKMRGALSLAGVILVSLGMVYFSNQIQREVIFSDPGVEEAVRSAIGKPEGTIYQHQLSTIVEMDLSGRNIETLEGIEGLRNLRVLNLSNNRVQNLSHITSLVKLQRLDLSGNQLADISPLGQLPDLEELLLRQNKIEDITALGKLSGLKVLDLSRNRVSEIEPLGKMFRLEELNLRENRISDISPLAELTNLTYLNLHSNSGIVDIAPVSNLTRLETLVLRNVPVGGQVSMLSSLRQLRRLNLRNSGLDNAQPLVELLLTGALQDDEANGIHAELNLLENPLLLSAEDSFQGLRPYWQNITYRYPYTLPVISTTAAPPVFSHESGFYEDGFLLTLGTNENGGRIFYTLDGSEPSISAQSNPAKNTFEYNGPISIVNRSNEDNRYASIETSRINTYTPPGDIFKGTVVRAVVLNEDGSISPIETHSFFVDENFSEQFSLPVISITSQPEGLFSDQMGIYVPGELYQNWYPNDMRWNPANYTQTGLKWERPATVQLFNSDGEMLLQQDAGIRIHGGASRSFPQKSLRLYADSGYGELDTITFDFFPDLNQRISDQPVSTFETLILRTGGGGDWEETMVRDVIAQSLLQNTRLDIQGNYPVIVFLNGEYWGIHNIRSRYDTGYFQNYYGISAEDLVICERGQGILYYGEAGDQNEYREMLEIIDEEYGLNGFDTVSTLADPEKYAMMNEAMDVENYIDYYISQIYAHKTDWPLANIMFWKKKVDASTLLSETQYGHDGKWRWMVIDMDLGFYDPEGKTLEHAAEEGLRETYLLRSLLQNPSFRHAFINRFADLLNSNFKEEVVLARVDEVEMMYAPEIGAHIQRWGTFGGSLAGWQANVEEIRQFARLRPEIQRQQIVDYFELPGTAALTISTEPTQGYVTVNTLDIREGTPGIDDPSAWTGIYFKGVPVTITAVPAEGYRFSHWEGLETGSRSNANVEISLTDDLALTALFTR